MVPLLLYVPQLLGFASIDMKVVAGITMVQSLAGSLLALIIHRRNRFVHRPLVLSMGMGSLTGGCWGQYGPRLYQETQFLGFLLCWPWWPVF